MIKNIALGVKIGFGFGIVILIAAILGFVGWSGTSNIRSYMVEYSSWSDIDMVMNEDVTQKVLNLTNAFAAYAKKPNEKKLNVLRGALDSAEKGTEKWHAMVKSYPELEQVALSAKKHLSLNRAVVDKHIKSTNRLADIRQRWDKLGTQCGRYAESVMEEVVDPAKANAERSEEISEMVKWSAIDMSMNEALISNILKLETTAHDYAAESNQENWARLLAALEAAKEGLKEWRKVVVGHERLEEAAGKIYDNLKEYEMLGHNYHEEVAEVQQSLQQVEDSLHSLYRTLEHTMENVVDPAKEASMIAADGAQKRAAFLVIGFALGGIFLGIFLAYFITKGITKPINRVIEGLNEGADQVASASGQVSAASQSLAEGSSEQAASIEETSSLLEEMSSMTKQNADNANQADGLMRETNQVVGNANRSMNELTNSMEEISKASEETSKIIKTIDEIAFQTNLLALNAAVEAARAGEAGAGFAVVADEVRNLAMRAADAAKSTSDLIEGTVKKVKDGSELVTRTNETFTEVAESSDKVGELVGEIAAASSEQARGIEQVNMAVVQMDKVTQQNAANAEESASASEEMNAQAVQMRGLVGELVSLVDGSRNGKGNGRGEVLQLAGTADVKGLLYPEHKPNGNVGALDVANTNTGGAGEVRPDQVIPLDSEDFRDF